MKRVVLDCRGRLANQLLCWANARHVLTSLGLDDRVIVINHWIPPNCVRFPGAVVESVNVEALPRVTREQLAEQTGDAVWIWEDIYFNFPNGNTIKQVIQTITLESSFEQQLNNTITGDNFVGIHARFGDYVEINYANPPDIMPPFVRAKKTYFLRAMALARELIPNVKFLLASDGTKQELEFITEQSDVVCGWSEALFDLFALAKCRVIVGSASTFSAVAANYGDKPLTTPAMSEAELREVIQC